MKNTNQAAGITAQHTFREHRSLFARVMTRIASLPSIHARHTTFQQSRQDIQQRRSETFTNTFTERSQRSWNSPAIILNNPRKYNPVSSAIFQ